MDRLAQLLAALSDISVLDDVELQARLTELVEAHSDAREGPISAEVVQLMEAAAEKIEAITSEQTLRSDIAAKLQADADANTARVRKALGQDDGDGETAPEADADGAGGDAGAPPEQPVTTGGEDESAEPAEPVVAEEPAEPLAASAPPPKLPVRDIIIPGRNRPRTHSSRPVVVASGEVRGVAPGHVFGAIDDLHEAMVDRWHTMRTSADGQMHYMGTIDYSDMYPEERRIRSGDSWEVSDQIMREIDKLHPRNREARENQAALVASGGAPGPSEPRYQQITYGQADRPLRDALPGFQATRGRIIYNESPTIADIVLDQSGGAIGTVTNTQDVAGATKTIQEISAPTSTEVFVEAEVLRFSQGNWADKFNPERTRAFMQLGQVAFARHNEALRLADIKAGSTKWTDTPAEYGAFRDLKRQFLGITEEIEDLVRDFGQPLRVLMPEYVPAMLAADMIAQQPGDDAWKITEESMRAEMRSWDPSVTFTFLKDSVRGRLSTTPSGQSPRTPGYDADVEWAIFPEGTWIYLDGGQLDLGIIRDSATSQLNKFQTFYEQWEAVARIAPLSFWVTSSLCANGASQIPLSGAACSPQGS